MSGGQQQTVLAKILEQKVGRILGLKEEFQTPAGRWRVIDIGRDGKETYTIQKLDD